MQHPRRKILPLAAAFLALLGTVGTIPGIWTPLRGVVRSEGESEPVRSESNREDCQTSEISFWDFLARHRVGRRPLTAGNGPCIVLPGITMAGRKFDPGQPILCEHCLRNGLGAPLLL